MDDDVRRAINLMQIEMDRLRGQVAGLTAYVAAIASPPEKMGNVSVAAREVSPPRLVSGGQAPADIAEFTVTRIAELSAKLKKLS